MQRKIVLFIAAAVTTLTIGAASFAVAAKAGYACCKPDRICCQTRQSYCN